ncbi:MAG: cyclase family protein [Candidatus Nanohaloarchaea archaeon]
MEFFDITLEIEEGMVVYPGIPRPEIERYRKLPADSTTESRIALGSHTGTHVDAPQHVFEDGDSVAEMDLESFAGEAQVLDLVDCKKSVERRDLENRQINAEIVLLKTDNSNHGYTEFREDFTFLELSGVKYLVDQGVETVCIDYLSLVEFDGGEEASEVHRLANREMTVIEGVDLRGVEPGIYIFYGFPLKLDADGAPLRAVLERV